MDGVMVFGQVKGGKEDFEYATVGYKQSGAKAKSSWQNKGYIWTRNKKIRVVKGVWLANDPTKVGTNHAQRYAPQLKKDFDKPEFIALNSSEHSQGFFQLNETAPDTWIADGVPVIIEYEWDTHNRAVAVDIEGKLETGVTVSMDLGNVVKGNASQANWGSAVTDWQLGTPFAPPDGVMVLDKTNVKELSVTQIIYKIDGGGGVHLRFLFYNSISGDPRDAVHIMEVKGSDGIDSDGFNIITLNSPINFKLEIEGTIPFKYLRDNGVESSTSWIAFMGNSK